MKRDWKKYIRNTAIYCKTGLSFQNGFGNGHEKKTIQTQFDVVLVLFNQPAVINVPIVYFCIPSNFAVTIKIVKLNAVRKSF